MNGGLYSAEEIEKGYASLERTLAPIEHPQDSQGNFISALDPIAIHNFHGGAFNQNVTRENGRVSIDKIINVQEALKSERGKRLLDRIDEIETSESPRPIHTSVCVFLDREETDGPMTNAAGQEYSWIAKNMVFDHDAILLDSVGAAQPGQGVGIAVNAEGKEFQVEQALVTIDADDLGEMSHSDIRDALESAINVPPLSGGWVVDIFEDRVIYSVDDQFFSAPYIMDGRKAQIVGIPLPVERDVAYIPKTNTQGDLMKELILNALKAANIETEGFSDSELFAKYNALQVNQESSDDKGASDDKATGAEVIANALKPFMEKLEGLEAKLNAADDQEIEKYAAIVANSDKYPGIDAESAKKLGVDMLKTMAANCGTAYGVPLTIVNSESGDEAYDMPA